MTKQNEVKSGLIDIDKVAQMGNVRMVFDKAKLEELAKDIKERGVLTPILLRTGDILVAGERRLRAARMAGLKQIPYIMKDMTDEQAAAAQLAENIQRENLNPIEEAKAICSLLYSGDYSHKDIADKLGKTTSYVYKSARLTELPTQAQSAIAVGKLTPMHGHHLLRVPAEKREEMLEYALKPNWRDELPSLTEFASHIEDTMGSSLEHTVFPTDCDYAGKPPCAGCAHNSANQTELFAEAEKGNCMDKACFAAKVKAYDEFVAGKAASQYKGMKYLGQHSKLFYDYNSGGMYKCKTWPVVNEDTLKKHPELKKAMKSEPAKFGYIVYEHKVMPVITDKDMIAAMCPKKEEAKKLSPEEKLAQEKQEFIAERVKGEACYAFLTSKGEIKEELLNDLLPSWLSDSISEPILKAAGIKEWDDDTRKRIDGRLVLKILWLHTMREDKYDFGAEDLKVTGIDVKGIQKAAGKAAEAEWPNELARREAARLEAEEARRKPAKEQEEDEDDGEDE